MLLLHKRHRFRLALCGHKAAEAGSVCLLPTVQGNLAAATLTHLEIASSTGLAADLPALFVTFTRYERHLTNRWTSSAFFALCSFVADSPMHESHYPGEYTEAALTAPGAFAFSLAVSFTPIGKAIDRLAEHVLPEHSRAAAAGS